MHVHLRGPSSPTCEAPGEVLVPANTVASTRTHYHTDVLEEEEEEEQQQQEAQRLDYVLII